MMILKNLLWISCIPASISYSILHSKIIHYLCLATGVIVWTCCSLIIISILLHANSPRRRYV